MFLSGGIDSSAVAAIMARQIDRPLQTFSVAFEERAFNELAYAREVARAIGAEAHEVVIGDREFFGALPRLLWHEDEPIAHPSSVPLYFVSALARRHVTVVLTGEGSDELLAGYGKYLRAAWNWRAGLGLRTPGPRSRFAGRLPHGVVPRVPNRLGRYARRSCLAMDRSPESMFFDNFAAIRLAQQQNAARRRISGAPRHARTPTGRRWPTPAPERPQHAARSTAVRRHQDVSGRAAHEAGPDEHGGFDRKPGAVSRSQAGGVRRAVAGPMEAVGVDDQARAAGSHEGPPAGLDPQPARKWDSPCRSRGGCEPAGTRLRATCCSTGARASAASSIRQPSTGCCAAMPPDAADDGDRIWSLLNLELWYRTFIDKEGVQTLPEPPAPRYRQRPARADARIAATAARPDIAPRNGERRRKQDEADR